MRQLGSMIEDADGGFSTMRVVLLVWTLATAIVWTWCSIQAGSPQAMPESMVALFLGGVTGKVVQRQFEKPETNHEK